MKPNCTTLEDTYAIEFPDATMEPVFKRGRPGWVHTRRRAEPDDDVMVQLLDGSWMVRLLLRRTDSHLVLRQYSPQEDCAIRLADVKSLHVVVAAQRVVA